MALNGLDINTLDDVEAACLVYALYKRMQQRKERKKIVTNRRWWVHPLNLKRPQEGQFEVTFPVLRQYPEEFFKYFRMSIPSFDNLLTTIGEHVRKQNTVFCLSIPPEERLAATLRYLATGTNFSALHFDFLMGVSTIRNIIKETCGILWDILYPMEMAPPIMEEWRDLAAGFYENSSFPNTVGAVDGKHIRPQCPKKSGSLYYNYKKIFSIILLAVCDSNYCLRVIDIGSYGKESDCNILKRSTFGKQLYSGKVNFPPDNQLPGDENGDPQPFVLVGDEAFALSKNLLRPFPGRSLNDRRRIFNYRLSRAIKWKKEKIIQWLTVRGKIIDQRMVKDRLLEEAQEFRTDCNKYVIDELAKENNKIVLRLPPYHCELNPIELAWSCVKQYVKMNNTTYKLPDVKQLLIEGVERVSPDMWKNFISHVIKEEEKLCEIDFITDDMLDAVA